MDFQNYYLPEHYSPDDKKWIAEKLSKVPEKVRRKVAAKYSEVYLDAYNNETVTHKKQNAAIKSANLWLLGCVKQYSPVMKGAVCKPPIVTQ